VRGPPFALSLNEQDASLQRIKQAFRREKRYRVTALEDLDLEPLWESLGGSAKTEA